MLNIYSCKANINFIFYGILSIFYPPYNRNDILDAKEAVIFRNLGTKSTSGPVGSSGFLISLGFGSHAYLSLKGRRGEGNR